LSDENGRECISGKISVLITKYLFIPFILIFLSVIFVLLILDHFNVVFINLLYCSIIVIINLIGLYSIKRLKVLYMNRKGIFFNEIEIAWNEIEKLSFPIIRPQYLVIKLNESYKSKTIFSILPFFHSSVIKKRIILLRKRNNRCLS